MPPRPCPTCKRNNCGNHAACARRKAMECERCGHSPCYDQKHCTKSWEMWKVIGMIEREVLDALAELRKEGPLPIPEPIDDKTMGDLRRTVFDLLFKAAVAEEEKRSRQLLAKFMFR